jgi:hypothetical protein
MTSPVEREQRDQLSSAELELRWTERALNKISKKVAKLASIIKKTNVEKNVVSDDGASDVEDDDDLFIIENNLCIIEEFINDKIGDRAYFMSRKDQRIVRFGPVDMQ